MDPDRLTAINVTRVPASVMDKHGLEPEPDALAELPVPDGLEVRESQLLVLRCPQQPTEKVVVMRGGDSIDMSPDETDQFADQLVSFAAQVRRLARQARGRLQM